VTNPLPGTLIPTAAEELAHLILEDLLQDQPRSQPPDRLDRSPSPPTPASTSSSSERNLSLGATFSMRAYLHLRLAQGQSGGYARLLNPPADETRPTQLIEGGAELAAASIGAAVGLIGGPPGAFGGAAAGVTATRLLRRLGADIQKRMLAPRQRIRTGAAYAIAAEEISRRLRAGESLRADGFFDTRMGGRPAAEELLEGVLHAAADAYEERKVTHLGKL
jgi:hypothetical protein